MASRALAAFQLVIDTLGTHDRGAVDLTEAESAVGAAEGVLTRARQRLVDVESDRAGSATTLIGHARAAIAVLEGLIVEYSPVEAR